VESRTTSLTANITLATNHLCSLAFFDYARRIAQRFAALLAWLIGPMSLIAYAFAAWRVAADIGWSASFVIPSGFFSHWLVWISIGLALTFSASMLKDGPEPANPTEEPASE
jgi:hypothetical protein